MKCELITSSLHSLGFKGCTQRMDRRAVQDTRRSATKESTFLWLAVRVWPKMNTQTLISLQNSSVTCGSTILKWAAGRSANCRWDLVLAHLFTCVTTSFLCLEVLRAYMSCVQTWKSSISSQIISINWYADSAKLLTVFLVFLTWRNAMTPSKGVLLKCRLSLWMEWLSLSNSHSMLLGYSSITASIWVPVRFLSTCRVVMGISISTFRITPVSSLTNNSWTPFGSLTFVEDWSYPPEMLRISSWKQNTA